jgi:cytochrome P450
MRRRALLEQLPPGPGTPPLFNLVGLWKRPTACLERLRPYGKRATIAVPFQPPFVVLWDPDDIKQLFTASPEAVHPGEGARILEPILGRHSVILLDEGEHLQQRKLMLPAFHGEKMQRLTGLMTGLTQRELDTWPIGEPFALHPRLQRLTLEIILRAVFGLATGQRLDDLRETLTELLEFSESPLSILPSVQRVAKHFGRFRRFDQLTRRATELIFEQIAERRAAPGGEHDDVLAMLLHARHEDESPMSDQEIRDELMTALVAGHETTASQLAWAFELLAHHPQIARRVRDGDEEYLMATIHEIMRCRPVLPNAEPRLTKQPIEIGGVRYPAGVLLLASVYLVHHDPEIYPEPYVFRPERFLFEEPQPDDPGAAQLGEAGSRAGGRPGTYTWIPFGGGRRRCLGASFAMQEMKIVLREVLARFEFAPGCPEPEVTGRRSITYSPSRGATLVLARGDRAAPEPVPELASAA